MLWFRSAPCEIAKSVQKAVAIRLEDPACGSAGLDSLFVVSIPVRLMVLGDGLCISTYVWVCQDCTKRQ